jgi:hypothetical protein
MKWLCLREITALGAELVLPNIYSMTARYQDEDGWRDLRPPAAEIYQ